MAENGGKRARRWESVGRLALRIMNIDIDDIGGLRGHESANSGLGGEKTGWKTKKGGKNGERLALRNLSTPNTAELDERQ